MGKVTIVLRGPFVLALAAAVCACGGDRNCRDAEPPGRSLPRHPQAPRG